MPQAESLLKRTVRGAGWVMAWRLGMRALGLISTLVLVRLIAPADFGIIALASGFAQTIDGALSLGTEEAVIREAAPGRAFYDTAFTLNLARGVSVALLVAALAIPAAKFFGDQRLGPVLLFVACLPALDGVANIGAVDFRRDFAFQREFALMVLPKACGITAAMASAFLLHSYVAMLVGTGVNLSMRVVMSYAMHPFRPRLSLHAWRGLAGYSVWTWFLSVAALLRDRCDSLLIGRLLGTASVGFYSVGLEIAALPMTELIEPLGRAAFSGFAAGRRERADLAEAFLRLIGLAAALVLPAGVGLSLMAAPLVALAFGPGWEQTVPVLRVLAVGLTVMVLGHLSQHLLSAHALLGRLAGITVVGAVVRVALLAYLIPRFGLTGAALAATLGIVLEQGLTVAAAMRRLRVGFGALLSHTARPVVATSVMTAVLTGSGFGWSEATGLPSLLIGSGVGAAVYASALAGSWLMAGRPPGAEADALGLLGSLLHRTSGPETASPGTIAPSWPSIARHLRAIRPSTTSRTDGGDDGRDR